MKAYDWLFSFRFTAFVFLFLICPSVIRGEPDAGLNNCNINRHLKYLFHKWTWNSWPQGTSGRCMGYILLQWAYQLRGALEGSTTTKNTDLDEDTNNLESKCKPYLRRRTNRSSLDALQDVFNLLLKLAKILEDDVDVDWCYFTSTHGDDTFYNQTLTLVRRLNRYVRRQNRMYL